MNVKSALINAAIVAPSLLPALYLANNHVPLDYAYFLVCTIILLAVFNFATVIFIEQYRNTLGKLTLPSLLASIAIIFLYMVTESLNHYIENLGYGFLAPFAALTILLLYVAVFAEKNIALKSYLCINSVALTLLLAMGFSDKIKMPF